MVPSLCSMKGTKQYVDHGGPLEGKTGHLSTWNPGLGLLHEGLWV